jgi:hypothetical protein
VADGLRHSRSCTALIVEQACQIVRMRSHFRLALPTCLCCNLHVFSTLQFQTSLAPGNEKPSWHLIRRNMTKHHCTFCIALKLPSAGRPLHHASVLKICVVLQSVHHPMRYASPLKTCSVLQDMHGPSRYATSFKVYMVVCMHCPSRYAALFRYASPFICIVIEVTLYALSFKNFTCKAARGWVPERDGCVGRSRYTTRH